MACSRNTGNDGSMHAHSYWMSSRCLGLMTSIRRTSGFVKKKGSRCEFLAGSAYHCRVIGCNFPPWTKPCIATPITDAVVRSGSRGIRSPAGKTKSRTIEHQCEDGPADDDDPKADGAEVDHKLGFDLWRRFKTVISLSFCSRCGTNA